MKTLDASELHSRKRLFDDRGGQTTQLLWPKTATVNFYLPYFTLPQCREKSFALASQNLKIFQLFHYRRTQFLLYMEDDKFQDNLKFSY